MSRNVTLCLLVKDDTVLLAKKRRGFGVGKYNGVGGKVEMGETIEQGMLREVKEEIGVTLTEYKKLAEIDYDEFYDGKRELLKLHLYVSHAWQGNPTESDEMIPTWFKFDEIPYEKCFADDRYWMPMALREKLFKAFFYYDEDWNLIEMRMKLS